MQHARDTNIVDIDQFAGRFRWQVDARDRLADDLVGIDSLQRDIIGEFQPQYIVADQLTEADAAVIAATD